MNKENANYLLKCLNPLVKQARLNPAAVHNVLTQFNDVLSRRNKPQRKKHYVDNELVDVSNKLLQLLRRY